ncbi:ADP-ribosyltransferase domain-containing protein [Nocardia acidivorans]|uniref:ADP-ribosyltransferase domain-containing protein n=1 Tax=Nocardia acidivorans TaxID=404580 RepID=UPI0008366A4C|nr:ADP-ribosyltransferase domain-containing protein [Nocardia acidivorans]
MNEAMRMGRIEPRIRAEIDALRAALVKLPDHVGMVYRGVELPPSVLARYQKGSIVDEVAFLSTSTKDGTFTGAVRFRIRAKRGKKITAYSKYAGEHEVVFLPGSRFQVDKRKYNRLTATTWIDLTEV